MRLILRSPFTPEDRRVSVATWPATLFVILVSGFVTYELSSESEFAKRVFLWAPQQATVTLVLSCLSGWVEGAWTTFIIPTALWGLLLAATRIRWPSRSPGYALRGLASPLAPLVMAGHMAKALPKLNTWAGFLPLATHEPQGIATVTALANEGSTSPGPIAAPATVTTLSLALMALAAWLAIREFRITQPQKPMVLPAVALAAFYGLLVVLWY